MLPAALAASPSPTSPPTPRRLGRFNGRGLCTLARKEIGRFMSIALETVLAPTVVVLLFFVVFDRAFGGENKTTLGIPFMLFLAPGLIMMAVAQNAFMNTSSSLILSKLHGNIVDILMAPLSPFEFTLGYALGGLARGVAVGGVALLVMTFVAHLPYAAPGFLVFHLVMGSLLVALLGLLSGIAFGGFEQIAAVQSFVITPATFLSGTFYTLEQLPETWRTVCLFNPFFYMIDGFRYGLTGVADGPLGVGMVVITGLDLALFALAYVLVARGYKLKT